MISGSIHSLLVNLSIFVIVECQLDDIHRAGIVGDEHIKM